MSESSMFHAGDLNSGISRAISEQKLVACFIRADDDTTSTTWQDDWLTDLQEIIAEKAVLLRLDFGSREAGFLGAFCSIDKAPTLVVIHNGKVLEKLEGGLEREEWVERLLRALGVEGMAAEEEAGEAQVDETPAAVPDTAPTQRPPPAHSSQAAASSSQPLSSAQTPSSLFPDRAQRLEADKVKRDAADKAEKQARADARRKEAEDASRKGKQPASSEDAGKSRARDQWIYEQKQRKDQAKKDKERILKQIEADKAERKARTQRAKEAEREAGAGASETLPEGRMAGSRRSAGAGGTCQLLIRLFDGSSLRGRFATDSTLAKGVRDWIKQEAPQGSGGADIPFTFRQILAPQPLRSIEISQEHETLADLDLIPNATLVLVPVSGAASAYDPANAGYVGWGYSLLSGAYNRLPNVSYYLPSFSRLYMGGTGDPQEASNVQGAAMAGTDSQPAVADAGVGAAKVRMKTLADQRAEDAKKKPTDFYNGNSLKFEERKDDDGKDAGEQ